MLSNPSNAFEWILSIVLFAISLGLLITLHELGHLFVAKIFKVYCFEFSVGFGPAIFRTRGKNKETYFALRAFPLGGYVSMYGEDAQLPEGEVIPKNRSLEGIIRPKRALIFSAGIIMNALLAFALFFASNVFFPVQNASTTIHVDADSIISHTGIKNEDKLYFVGPSDGEIGGEKDLEAKILEYQYETSKATYIGYYYIIDNDVVINDKHYMCVYYPTGAKKDTVFTSGIKLFPQAVTEDEIKLAKEHCKQFASEKWTPYLNFVVDFAGSSYSPSDGSSFIVELPYREYYKNEKGKVKYKEPQVKSFEITSEYLGKESYQWKSVGLSLKVTKKWLPFGERIGNTFKDMLNGSIMIFQGLASIFKTGIKGLSGIVGIFTTSASVYSSYSFATYLYFWGIISINLAVFNLLPFPGLDGWQLLVTIIEGSVNVFKRAKHRKMVKATPEGAIVEEFVEWKIPTKVKAIMSYVGLGLLLILGIAIIIFDIIRLF